MRLSDMAGLLPYANHMQKLTDHTVLQSPRIDEDQNRSAN